MPSNTKKKCPACGAESTGKFCNSCGAPLEGAACQKCGAKLSGHGKFCPECGAPTGAGPAASADRTPWIVAGVAVVALVVVLVVVVARGPAAGPAEGAAAAAAGMPNFDQLTPREAADRLFDHVARAQAAGDTAQIAQFAPMALQAYALLQGDLDADARLHIGLIHEAVGNRAGVLAEADTILRGSATHLFGLDLRMRAAEMAGDAAARRRAAQAYLQSYDAERAKNLPEYGMHVQLLVESQAAAQRTVGAAAR